MELQPRLSAPGSLIGHLSWWYTTKNLLSCRLRHSERVRRPMASLEYSIRAGLHDAGGDVDAQTPSVRQLDRGHPESLHYFDEATEFLQICWLVHITVCVKVIRCVHIGIGA